MGFFRRVAMAVMFLASVCAVAGDIRYGADLHQSAWEAEVSKLHCTLSQDIPNYGRARFMRDAGGKLSFGIRVLSQPRDVGVAHVLAEAPPWMHETEGRELGQINYKADETPFSYTEIMTRRLLLELQQGMMISFTYQDWADGRDHIRVTISPVNIHDALEEFYACLDTQFVFGFDYVRTSRIRFAFNSNELDNAARKRLDEIALYLKSDDTVTKVLLEGRTDNVGFRRYNQALAEQRTAAVRDYLVSKGVAGEKITITTTGEKQPLASNQTPQGRALNRSVDVTLSK